MQEQLWSKSFMTNILYNACQSSLFDWQTIFRYQLMSNPTTTDLSCGVILYLISCHSKQLDLRITVSIFHYADNHKIILSFLFVSITFHTSRSCFIFLHLFIMLLKFLSPRCSLYVFFSCSRCSSVSWKLIISLHPVKPDYEDSDFPSLWIVNWI